MKKIILSVVCVAIATAIVGCDGNNTKNSISSTQPSAESTSKYIKQLVIDRSSDEVLSDMTHREDNLKQIKKIDNNFFDYYYSYDDNDKYLHLVSMSFSKTTPPMFLNYAEIESDLKNKLNNNYDAPTPKSIIMPTQMVPAIGASNGGSESSVPCINDYKINITFNKESAVINDFFNIKDVNSLVKKYNGKSDVCVDTEDYNGYRVKDYNNYLYYLEKNKEKDIKQSVYNGDIKVPANF